MPGFRSPDFVEGSMIRMYTKRLQWLDNMLGLVVSSSLRFCFSRQCYVSIMLLLLLQSDFSDFTDYVSVQPRYTNDLTCSSYWPSTSSSLFQHNNNHHENHNTWLAGLASQDEMQEWWITTYKHTSCRPVPAHYMCHESYDFTTTFPQLAVVCLVQKCPSW